MMKKILAGQICTCQLNTSLSEIGESPIKLHRVPQHSCSNYKKQNLFSMSKEMTKRVVIVLKATLQETVCDKTTGESNSKQANKRLETLVNKWKR